MSDASKFLHGIFFNFDFHLVLLYWWVKWDGRDEWDGRDLVLLLFHVGQGEIAVGDFVERIPG